MSYFGDAGILLVKAVFGFFVTVVMLRFLLQLVRADFYNPVSQFLVKVTNPLLVPLRRIVPGLGGLDLAAVLLMFLLQLGETYLLALLMGVSVSWPALLVLTVAQLLDLAIKIYLVTLIVQAILSWIQPSGHHPVMRLLHQLNEPLLAPVRRVLPDLGGIDLSPLVVLVLLQLASVLLVAPIADLARSLH